MGGLLSPAHLLRFTPDLLRTLAGAEEIECAIKHQDPPECPA